MSDEQERRGCLTWLATGGLIGLIGYVPSSGPVLAAAFWLREATGWDGFYGVMYLYYPLLAGLRGTAAYEWLDRWITWWVELFGTVGPG